MKALQGFLALLLVASIVGTSLSLTLNQTVLNAEYLKAKSIEVRLAESIAENWLDNPVDPQGLSESQYQEFVAQIRGSLKPDMIQKQLDDLFVQFENYTQGTAETITVDIRELAQVMQPPGLEIPAEELKPVTLNKSEMPGREAFDKIDQVFSLSLWILLLVLIVEFGLALKTGRYGSLITAFVLAAVIEGLLYGLLRLAPSLIIPSIPLDAPNLKPYSEVITQLITTTANDLGQIFGLTAIGLLVLAIICFGFSHLRKASPSVDKKS